MLVKAGMQFGKQYYLIRNNFRKWKGLIKCEAEGILRKLNIIEVAFMTLMWSFILQNLDKAIKTLQVEDALVFTAVECMSFYCV